MQWTNTPPPTKAPRPPPGLRRLLTRAAVSGAVASLASTVVLTLACRRDGKPAASGTNATSHWIWGRAAWYSHHSDLRHTVLGYLIHHASSMWWACVYEAWNLHRRPRHVHEPLQRAVAVAAVAAAVDYAVVPERLTPGFEAHLQRPAITAVYAAFAAGLAVATWARRPSPRR